VETELHLRPRRKPDDQKARKKRKKRGTRLKNWKKAPAFSGDRANEKTTVGQEGGHLGEGRTETNTGVNRGRGGRKSWELEKKIENQRRVVHIYWRQVKTFRRWSPLLLFREGNRERKKKIEVATAPGKFEIGGFNETVERTSTAGRPIPEKGSPNTGRGWERGEDKKSQPI